MRVRGHRRNADVTGNLSDRNQGKNDTVSFLLEFSSVTRDSHSLTNLRRRVDVTADAMPQRMAVAAKAGCFFATRLGHSGAIHLRPLSKRLRPMVEKRETVAAFRANSLMASIAKPAKGLVLPLRRSLRL
jgi:hypothetical protein